jgi:hypothetical protein
MTALERIAAVPNFYVFFTTPNDPIPVYERTCGTRDAADARCTTLEGYGHTPFIMLNSLPSRFYY